MFLNIRQSAVCLNVLFQPLLLQAIKDQLCIAVHNAESLCYTVLTNKMAPTNYMTFPCDSLFSTTLLAYQESVSI